MESTTTTSCKQPWPILFLCCVLSFNSMGMSFGMGAIFTDFMDAFTVSRATASLVQSVCIGFMFLTGVFTGHLQQRQGPRVTVITGSVLATAGCVIAFLATHIAQVIVGIGGILGIGLSFTYLTTHIVLATMFHDSKGLAIALNAVCAAAGSAVYPLLYRYLAKEFSLRGVFLIMATINCQMILCGAVMGLFAPRSPEKTSVTEGMVKEEEMEDAAAHKGRKENTGKSSGGAEDCRFTEGNLGENRTRRFTEGNLGENPTRRFTEGNLGENRTRRFTEGNLGENPTRRFTEGNLGENPTRRFTEGNLGENRTRRFTEGNLGENPTRRFTEGNLGENPTRRFTEGNLVENPTRRFTEGNLGENPTRRFTEGNLGENPTRRFTEGNLVENPTRRFTEGNLGENPTRRFTEGNLGENPTRRFTEGNLVENPTRRFTEGNLVENPTRRFTEGNLGENPTRRFTEGNLVENPTRRFEKNCKYDASDCSCCDRIQGTCCCELTILQDKTFILFTVFGASAHVFLIHPVMFMADMVTANQLTADDASFFLTILFCSSLLSRVLAGVLYKLFQSKILLVYSVSIAAGGVVCLFYAFIGEYSHFVAASVFLGFSVGVMAPTIPMVYLELLGPRRFSIGRGYVGTMEGVYFCVAGPFGGLIRDLTNSYKPLFYIGLAHGLFVGSLLFFTALRFLRRS